MPRKEQEPTTGDFGTPEARRRAFWVVEQPDPEQRSSRRIRVQDPLDWYVQRGYLTIIQADALKRWRDDAEAAGYIPSCIGNYQQSIYGSFKDISEHRMAAQGRRDNAMRFLSQLGRRAILLVDAVAVNGHAASRWWMEHIGGPTGEALELLSRSANGLARHYQLAK